MKLLQLNMWMGRLTRQILPLIKDVQPDIITAQEVFSTSQPIAFPDTTFDLYERVQQLGYSQSFFSPTFSLSVCGQPITFGNAIFCTLPMTTSNTIFTSGTFQSDMLSKDFYPNIRNLQVTTIDIAGKKLHICNHHGYWESNPTGSEHTVQSMRRVIDTIQTLPEPVILAGDLNINPDAPAMQLFAGILEDLTKTYAISSTLSVLGKVQDVAPDHILVSDTVRVQSFQVLDTLVSDHKALLLEFDI